MTNQTSQKNDHMPPGQDRPVSLTLDSNPVTSPSRRLNGKQIRELGDPNRVDGFETQRVNCETNKKVQTIRDDDTVQLHDGECFRTVPNQGGPGASD